jgi:hypothetical protein
MFIDLAAPPLLAAAADFGDVQVGWVRINAICTGSLEFVPLLRSQHVPDAVADDGGRVHADT